MVDELRRADASAAPTSSSRSESGPGNGAPEERSGAAHGPRGGGASRRPRGGGGKRFQGKPKVCLFCVEKGQRIDYKQTDILRRFVNETGKIRPRRQTGTCARHQRLLAVAIKRARHLALIPFTARLAR